MKYLIIEDEPLAYEELKRLVGKVRSFAAYRATALPTSMLWCGAAASLPGG